MINLTLVMAVYGQPLMLKKQVETIKSYAEDIRSRLSVILVDDCGDPPVDFHEYENFSLKKLMLFRVDEDIHWNQMGARNLGMHHASGWCVMVDPDMVFREPMMRRMMNEAAKLKRGTVVRWALRHMNSGKLDSSSPNTWLIHRDDFFAVGGYDEDYAGGKGFSDVQLLDVLTSVYKVQRRADIEADFYSNKLIADAMVTKLNRSVQRNTKLRLKKVEQKRAAGGWAKWVKKRMETLSILRFSWRQIFPSP
jgi:hypothetical protein